MSDVETLRGILKHFTPLECDKILAIVKANKIKNLDKQQRLELALIAETIMRLANKTNVRHFILSQAEIDEFRKEKN